MILTYDYGHGTGQDRGADGIVNEEAEIRKYGPVVVNELLRQGHTLINCTPVDPNMDLNSSLGYRVSKANSSGSQLHLCFHVNAFNGSAHGAEIEVASDNGAKYAQSILAEIVKLGFTDRGVNRPNLYVTKNTNMPAVLIEPFFCDSSVDIALYNPNTLGLAIAKGIINIIGGNSKPIIAPTPALKVFDTSIPKGDNITSLGALGYVETLDNRITVHLDKYTYISMQNDGQESHIDLFTRQGSKRLI